MALLVGANEEAQALVKSGYGKKRLARAVVSRRYTLASLYKKRTAFLPIAPVLGSPPPEIASVTSTLNDSNKPLLPAHLTKLKSFSNLKQVDCKFFCNLHVI